MDKLAKLATVNDDVLMNEFRKWDGEEGDALAPLGQLQQDSFLELASIASNRAMPIEVPLNDPVNVAHKVAISTVPTPGSTDDILSKGFSKLGLDKEKVETAQQFYSWFGRIEEEMEKLNGERYTQQLEVLKNYHDFCSDINKDLKKSLQSLDKLENECLSVTTKTNALHDACEQLLSDQTHLINLAENIEQNLEYFTEYDSIQKYLSSPNLIVTGNNFSSTLKKIDSCMDFMNDHPSYMESQNYFEKYKACLMQALGMIKSYTVKSLESTTQSILNRKDESEEDTSKPVVIEDAFTLYYGKFRANAPKIKGLTEELESRVSKSADYQRYLSDIHASYFAQRELLLAPSVTNAMSDLLNQHQKDHCALVRSSCAFMLHVCEDEHQLFAHFFSVFSPQLHEMLIRLCVNLYDMLRPLIIHIYHLETLAELCMILKTEMIDDHIQNNSEQLQAFHQVVLQMLEDVQERLVFRANIYVRDEIRAYNPSPGDLAYPAKLEMMEKIALKIKMEEENKKLSRESFTEIRLNSDEESDDVINQAARDSMFKESAGGAYTSPADIHGMWFPTVRRVLLCLSKLYRCIDKTIFQGLSQEALEACVESLGNASKLIIANGKMEGKSAQKESSKMIDGQLFLIKHLLILREQITPFQAEFVIRETQLDFTKTRDAAMQFMSHPGSSFPNLLRTNSQNSILKLVVDGTPQVKEFYVDSKKDVDRQLKEVCEKFIESQAKHFCSSLSSFIRQATSYVELKIDSAVGNAKVTSDLNQLPFAKPELVHDLVSENYRKLKVEMKKTMKSLTLYLANKETEQILFKPIKMKIQQTFQDLKNIVDQHYTEEEQQIIAAPTPEQIGLLITSTMKQ